MMLAVKCKPQATAVELAQLSGEGDSPQCGEMSRRDKRAGHLLKWRASCSPKSNVSHETIRENKLFFHVGCNYRAAGK